MTKNRVLSILTTVLLFITGISLIGLSGCKYCYKSNEFDAEALYANLPLGVLSQYEMIQYLCEQGGTPINFDKNEGLFRIQYENNYLVLVRDADEIVQAIAVYAQEGEPVYLYGIKPIHFDCNHLPTTYDEILASYGEPHGERGSGLRFLCYLTDNAEIVAFHVGRRKNTIADGEAIRPKWDTDESIRVLSIYTEAISATTTYRNYLLEPIG